MDDPALPLLVGAALVAGAIDAIAGGGGLVTLPALLAAGLPPHLALGTNKGQSVFGSGAALVSYARMGLVDARQARVTFPAGLAGSLGGAALVLVLDPAHLRPLVLALLVAVAALLALRPGALGRGPATALEGGPPTTGEAGAAGDAGRRRLRTAGLLALSIGAYDGFFGPGTGTFLIAGFAAFLGTPLVRASADAKVVNFASNLAAVAIFASQGAVVWRVALPMAAAQAIGGTLGARIGAKGGERVIRVAVLCVVAALVVKLASDARP